MSLQLPVDKAGILYKATSRIKTLKIKEKCEENMLDFVEYVWPVVEPSRPFIRGWVLSAIADHLRAVTDGHIKRLLINVPPGATKSLMTDVFWPAWEWGPRDMPSMRYVCFSYSSHLTERDNMRCRNVISSSRYQELWGDRCTLSREQFTKVKFGNLQTGWKLATSVAGIGVGERGDRLVIDDPNEVVDMESEAIRNTTKLWFTEVIPDRLNNQVTSAIVIIQQRLHEEDVSGIALSRNMGYTHLMVPMYYEPRIYCNGWVGDEIKTLIGSEASAAINEKRVFWQDPRTEDGELMWPERFPLKQCEELRNDKGPNAWCNPGDAPVLMADFSLKSIEQIAVGDKVVGFVTAGSGELDPGRRARLKETTVLSISKSVRQTVKITMESGEVIRCTPDHKWYTGRHDKTHPEYAPAYASGHKGPGRRTRGSALYRVCPAKLPEIEDQRLAGWLGGFFDGEGSATLCHRHKTETSLLLTFTQGAGRNLPLCKKLEYALTTFGFQYNYRERTRSDRKSLSSAVAAPMMRHYWIKTGSELGQRASRTAVHQRFLHTAQPVKWRDRIVSAMLNGRMYTTEERVVSIEPYTEETVYGLETTTGNYVIWGLASSNSGQYQQSPQTRGGNIIKQEYWQIWEEDRFPNLEYILASLDTAYTEKETNNPSALTIWGLFRDKNGNPKVILMYAWRKWLSFHALVQAVMDHCSVDKRVVKDENGAPLKRFAVDRLIIESKASGISVAQEMTRLYGFSGKFGIEIIDPKKFGDKVSRVHAIEHLFSQGLIYAPRRTFTDMVMDEMSAFPNGRFDDLTDSASMALRYLRETGLLLQSDEYAEEMAAENIYRPRDMPLYPNY